MKTIDITRSPQIYISTEEIIGKDYRETKLLSLYNHYKKLGYSENYIDAQLLSAGFSVKEVEKVMLTK